MVKFFKKYIFQISLVFLSIIFCFIVFFMFEVHIPYANYQNKNNAVLQEILKKNNLKYNNFFNVYNGNKTYYILKVKDNKKSIYKVYSSDKKFLKDFKDTVVNKEVVIDSFKKKYQKEVKKIEIGYENDTLVYVLSFYQDDKIIYAFYRLDTGEFIKAYNL